MRIDGNHERERMVFEVTLRDNCAMGGVVLEIQCQPLDLNFFLY
jgi:hypothetical protein